METNCFRMLGVNGVCIYDAKQLHQSVNIICVCKIVSHGNGDKVSMTSVLLNLLLGIISVFLDTLFEIDSSSLKTYVC